MPKRLELKPAGKVRAHEGIGVLGCIVRNSVGLARGFGEELRLAGTVHRDEPPGGFVDGVADGEQAVIAQDGGLFPAEGAGDAIAFGSFLDDPGVIIEDHVILVKRACVLGEGIEPAAERGPRFAIDRMGVRGGDNVRAGGVNPRVNCKGSEINFGVAFDDFAGMIHQDQVGSANLAKVQTEGIDPKMIEALGIARCDVAGDAFIKTKFGEKTKGSGEAFFAMAALFGRSGEDGRTRNTIHESGVRLRRGRCLRHGTSLRHDGAKELCPSAKQLGREMKIEDCHATKNC